MDCEEDKKEEISANTNGNRKEKKKYFRVEKDRLNVSSLREKAAKKIFKTQKEYHFPKRKVLKDLKRLKFHKSKRFITTKKEKSNLSTDKENFVVKKIIPKKLKIIKGIKTEISHMNYFSKTKENILLNEKNKFLNFLFDSEKNNSNSADGVVMNENKINCYKIKLMLVYFYSIKNLCKHINNNFFNTSFKEQKAIDEFIYQIYQSLQILDRKINEFKHFQNLKDDIRVNKDDFYDISSLKQNLLEMKKVLNNSMSQNLLNICFDIDNFCQIYSS